MNRLLLISALAAVLPVSGTCAGRVVTPPRVDGLFLELSLTTDSLRYGQSMQFIFRVKNSSGNPVRLVPLAAPYVQGVGVHQSLSLVYRNVAEQREQICEFWNPFATAAEHAEVLQPGDDDEIRFTVEQGNGRLLGDPYGGGRVYLSAWPPLPGQYTVHGVLSARAATGIEGAGEERPWVGQLKSGECTLKVPEYSFLPKAESGSGVSRERLDELIQGAVSPETPRHEEAVKELLALKGREASLELLTLARSGRCTNAVVEAIANRYGGAVAYDLALIAGRQSAWAPVQQSAAHALGRLGTHKALEVARPLMAQPAWYGRESFIAGLGSSNTAKSIRALKTLALEGSITAIAALAQRHEPTATNALVRVMQRGKLNAPDCAARVLADRGRPDGVDWLTRHWTWENAAAVVRANVVWPTPQYTDIDEKTALRLAAQVQPELPAPVARFWDGKWYVVSVGGSPQVAGHFGSVILNARTGEVVAQTRLFRVLR